MSADTSILSPTVTGTGDLDHVEDYYYDGQRMIEARNGSNQVVRGWMWGLRYVDELVAVLRNDDYPWANDFTHPYHVLQDANYNVLGVMSGSALVERYEYTPYGERTVLRYGGSNDPGCYAPSLTSSVPAGHYAGLCDIGHQGLMHDEESGLIYNRARHLQPQLGRFMQRDPAGYVDGMNAYQYVGSNPVDVVDPSGLVADQFEWERVSPWFFRAKRDGAKIKQLSQLFQENDESWQCIWPSTHLDYEKSRRLYPKAEAACGDVYDVSNLLKDVGPDLRIVFVAEGPERTLMANYTGFGTPIQGPDNLATYVRDQAQQGSTPISSMVVGSHGYFFHATAIRDGTISGNFFIGNLEKVATVKTGSPNFIAAKREQGPPRCWFRPGADVRFLGCRSSEFAKAWAHNMGRKRGENGWTWGTTRAFGTDGTIGWFQANARAIDKEERAGGVPYTGIWNQKQGVAKYGNRL